MGWRPGWGGGGTPRALRLAAGRSSGPGAGPWLDLDLRHLAWNSEKSTFQPELPGGYEEIFVKIGGFLKCLI